MDLSELYRQLKETQNTVFPLTSVPYTGLTVPCETDGEAAGFFDRYGKVRKEPAYARRFYSHETMVKARAADDATRALAAKYPAVSQAFAFPTQIEDPGQKEGENYFAILHIDGNNMGAKFRRCVTQRERSHLSENVRKKTEGCFGLLLEKIAGEYGSYTFLQKGIDDATEKPFIPIRPLILGGDDVTFVCPAKLAIRYAKYFIERMMDRESVKGIDAEDAESIDCGGGIAILKTTYPFFRGYRLAEQLTDAAKQVMRCLAAEAREAGEAVRGTSWLDFAILHGEQAPTLPLIRAQEYIGARGGSGDMHFGPYQVGNCTEGAGGRAREHRHDIENLIEAVGQFYHGDPATNKAMGLRKDTPCMTKGKIKEMRSVLQRGVSDAQRFLAQLAHERQYLPQVADWAVFADSANALWSGHATPYVDAIEMMDFIPEDHEEVAK